MHTRILIWDLLHMGERIRILIFFFQSVPLHFFIAVEVSLRISEVVRICVQSAYDEGERASLRLPACIIRPAILLSLTLDLGLHSNIAHHRSTVCGIYAYIAAPQQGLAIYTVSELYSLDFRC